MRDAWDTFTELSVLNVTDSENNFHKTPSRIGFLRNKNNFLIKKLIYYNELNILYFLTTNHKFRSTFFFL